MEKKRFAVQEHRRHPKDGLSQEITHMEKKESYFGIHSTGTKGGGGIQDKMWTQIREKVQGGDGELFGIRSTEI